MASKRAKPEATVAAPRPFLKWAGGKTQLLPELLPLFPKKFRTYYEPFVGAGAVFFALAHEKRFERALISDSNRELMGCYQAVRGESGALSGLLQEMMDIYEQKPASYYSEIRMNRNDTSGEPEPWFVIAARCIFLNKCGFNGLYRVNSKGEFNVPWGKRKKVALYDAENLHLCSEALNGFVSIKCGGWGSIMDAQAGDVVYLDPPYCPSSETANFTAYGSDGFNDQHQADLACHARILVQRGVTVIASNADVPLAVSLWSTPEFKLHRVKARRNINSAGGKRGPVGEIIAVGRR